MSRSAELEKPNKVTLLNDGKAFADLSVRYMSDGTVFLTVNATSSYDAKHSVAWIDGNSDLCIKVRFDEHV
jgi:hypothetical protein